MPIRAIALSFLIVLAAACMSQVEEPFDTSEMYDDLIHSDLPLFDAGAENIWPSSWNTEDSFGCVSLVAFGDWIMRERGGEDQEWYRFENYGVIHCFALVSSAFEREQLETAEARSSFFIRLGTELDQELWAIQWGARPGSDYVLLSRPVGQALVKEFEVLQVRCPSSNVRDGGSLDILLTRYCAVNSPEALLALARDMVQLRPRGTLTWVEAQDKRSD